MGRGQGKSRQVIDFWKKRKVLQFLLANDECKRHWGSLKSKKENWSDSRFLKGPRVERGFWHAMLWGKEDWCLSEAPSKWVQSLAFNKVWAFSQKEFTGLWSMFWKLKDKKRR